MSEPGPSSSVSPRRRREVVDALRRGTVPAQGLDLLAVGLDRFAAALAAAANTLLEDSDLRQRLAHGAAERAPLFAAEGMVARVLQVYDEALAIDK